MFLTSISYEHVSVLVEADSHWFLELSNTGTRLACEKQMS